MRAGTAAEVMEGMLAISERKLSMGRRRDIAEETRMYLVSSIYAGRFAVLESDLSPFVVDVPLADSGGVGSSQTRVPCSHVDGSEDMPSKIRESNT